jgi:hypothetical protein
MTGVKIPVLIQMFSDEIYSINKKEQSLVYARCKCVLRISLTCKQLPNIYSNVTGSVRQIF